MRNADNRRKIISDISFRVRICGLLSVWILGLVMASPAAAMRNPAAVYCTAFGYHYYSFQTKRGAVGLCELPDKRLVNASDFFRGKVALEYSYCATKGYQAKRDESGKICHDCLVCVQPNGKEDWVATLMELSFRESFCGDQLCDPATENYARCPEDCPSGGDDGFCDGVKDGRCDPDCARLGQYDPDCPDISVSPKAYDFEGVQLKKAKKAVFEVENKSSGDLSISSSITGSDASSFKITSNGGNKKIKPNGTLKITVTFKPASKGPKSAVLKITSNDVDTPKIEIPLSGTGEMIATGNEEQGGE